MKLLVTGLNHRTAPVEVRERVAFDAASLPPALRSLCELEGVLESAILSTCNRVEVVVAAEDNCDAPRVVGAFLREERGLPPDSLNGHLYFHEGREAIRHLFRVAASLDSMVVGEPQILGQFKAAYAAAKAEGALGGLLENVLTRAISVAKRVRSETDIGQSAVSVSYVAVELARDIFGSLAGHRVILVGAGKMSELAARHLQRAGASEILVANRTRQRAEEMAGLFHATVIEYERFTERLTEADILIASSGAPHYILTRDTVRRVMHTRRNRPMFLIDIAVPRNIEPEVNQLDNVFLYDIDDLQQVVQSNLQSRQKEADQAESIITEEVERLLAKLQAREVAPAIVGLQEQLEQLRQAELERVRGRLGTLTSQQEEAVEMLTRGIINKVAHGPITELRRNAGRPESALVVDLIRRLFRAEGS